MMTKLEFITELKKELGKLPYSEAERVIGFYDEAISDRMESGMTEEGAVADMGDIGKIVDDILTEYSLPVKVKQKIKDSHAKSGNKTLWVILAIIGFPIWLPILLSVLLVLFFVIFTLLLIIMSLYLVEFSLFLFAFASFVHGILNLFTNTAQGIASIGSSFTVFGMALLLILPLNALVKLIFKLIKKLFIFIGRIFKG